MRFAVRLSSCFIVASVSCCCAVDYNISSDCDSVSRWTLAEAWSSEQATAVPSAADVAALPESIASLPWPDGTQVLRFEDLEGAILVRAKLVSASGRDTSGAFVLDIQGNIWGGGMLLFIPLAIAQIIGGALYEFAPSLPFIMAAVGLIPVAIYARYRVSDPRKIEA